LVLGFGELGAVLQGEMILAAGLLLGALLMDGLAGQWARRHLRDSELGAELDSLAALMAFGVGAMVLAYEAKLSQLGIAGKTLVVGLAVATALRLAKDNNKSPDWPRYQGLPVPAFGACMGLFCTFADVSANQAALAGLALAVLMLAPLRYPRFSNSLWVQLPLGAVVSIAIFYPPWRDAVLMTAFFYAVGGPFFEFWGILGDPPKPRSGKARLS
jgi:CDP-diacylglycerol--serine O-phosphatidyltransferase